MLPRPAVAVFGCFAGFGIPVRTLPSRDFAHDGAPLKQVPVEGRPANPARRGLLPKRKMIGIKKSERLARTLGEKRLAPMEWFHPRDIDVSKVERLLSVVHPLGKRHSRAACRLYADRIEACRDKVVVQFRRKAQQVGIVRRKAFRPVEECLDAGGFENRHSCDRAFENRFEMVEVFRKLIEFEIFRYAFKRPRLRFELERPEKQFSCVFLVVRALVRNPQHRKRAQPVDRLRHDVEVFARLERNIHSREPADRSSPHARAIDHVFALDCPFAFGRSPSDRDRAAALGLDGFDLHVLEQQGSVLLRPASQRHRDVRGIALAVLVEIHG